MNYQGYLKNGTGTPSDEVFAMAFGIFPDSTGFRALVRVLQLRVRCGRSLQCAAWVSESPAGVGVLRRETGEETGGLMILCEVPGSSSARNAVPPN